MIVQNMEKTVHQLQTLEYPTLLFCRGAPMEQHLVAKSNNFEESLKIIFECRKGF